MAFWQLDLVQVHVPEGGGCYAVYGSTWKEREGDYSCPREAEPRTPPKPRRHIGQVWCDEPGGPNAAIGWATADQEAYRAYWQPFERGMMWQGIDGRVYVLYEEGAWQAY